MCVTNEASFEQAKGRLQIRQSVQPISSRRWNHVINSQCMPVREGKGFVNPIYHRIKTSCWVISELARVHPTALASHFVSKIVERASIFFFLSRCLVERLIFATTPVECVMLGILFWHFNFNVVPPHRETAPLRHN